MTQRKRQPIGSVSAVVPMTLYLSERPVSCNIITSQGRRSGTVRTRPATNGAGAARNLTPRAG